MKFYLEAWSAKQAWLDLNTGERSAYMAQLGPAIEGLMNEGTEIITWGHNDADTDKRLNYDFFAIWRFPTAEMAASFEKLVDGSGWHDYFEQVNLKGNPATPNDIIAKLIAL